MSDIDIGKMDEEVSGDHYNIIGIGALDNNLSEEKDILPPKAESHFKHEEREEEGLPQREMEIDYSPQNEEPNQNKNYNENIIAIEDPHNDLNDLDNHGENKNLGYDKIPSGLPSELNQIYYKLGDRKPIVNYDKENDPYMRITVMKSNADPTHSQEYFVTPLGMENSQKNTTTEDIIIGRQQETGNNIRPNDIVLPAVDRAISRIHCKIQYKNGFCYNQPIPDNFVAFLMLGHKRIGGNSKWHLFPYQLNKSVWEFLKVPRKFYIVDIGSVYGTYIKLNPHKNYPIEKGQGYLIGAETIYHIQDIWKPSMENQESNELINNQKLEDDFYRFLAYEKKNNVEIHGLNEAEALLVEKYQNELKSNISMNDTQIIQQLNYRRPYLKIEIQNAGPTTPIHIFVCNESDDKVFRIGRSQDATDVVINHNTISRKQCRIQYFAGEWLIADGDSQRESANGTWISLTDYRVKKGRNESEPKEIEHGTEIKISDSILKIEIFNNDPKKKKKNTEKKPEKMQLESMDTKYINF